MKARSLDPLDEVWEHHVRQMMFHAKLKLGPLTGLSRLIYDDLAMGRIDLKYTETLHLDSTLSVTLKMHEYDSIALGLEARIGVDDRGQISNLSIPAKGTVEVLGFQLKCLIGLDHALDIEWNAEQKAIEGTLMNDLKLLSVDISFDEITVTLGDNAGAAMMPSVWTTVEKEVTGVITDMFRGKITKMLSKVVKGEMSKVLQQINEPEEVPKFSIGFGSGARRDTDSEHKDDEEEESQNGSRRPGLFHRIRKLKF